MIELQLDPTPEAPFQARRAVTQLECDEACMDRLALLVSELVTNSLRHAGLTPDDKIRFYAEPRNGKAYVKVCDAGRNNLIATPREDRTEPGGLGLFIVDQLADRWGVERNDHTCVWFEVPRHEPLPSA